METSGETCQVPSYEPVFWAEPLSTRENQNKEMLATFCPNTAGFLLAFLEKAGQASLKTSRAWRGLPAWQQCLESQRATAQGDAGKAQGGTWGRRLGGGGVGLSFGGRGFGRIGARHAVFISKCVRVCVCVCPFEGEALVDEQEGAPCFSLWPLRALEAGRWGA